MIIRTFINLVVQRLRMRSVEEFCAGLRDTDSFDEIEVRVIHAMLLLAQRRKTKADASAIAKEAKLSVTNAYKYLYSLQSKGVVESGKDKQKVFWLSRSANPFPRLFSYVGRDYLRKKELFAELAVAYDRILPEGEIWSGEKVSEHYTSGFPERAAFLIDLAKEELFVAAERFYDDFVLLDAVRRALERSVRVRIVTNEIHASQIEKLEKAGLEIRLGRYWPGLILVDGKHGLTVDGSGTGVFWLNCVTEHKVDFERAWSRAQVMR